MEGHNTILLFLLSCLWKELYLYAYLWRSLDYRQDFYCVFCGIDQFLTYLIDKQIVRRNQNGKNR